MIVSQERSAKQPKTTIRDASRARRDRTFCLTGTEGGRAVTILQKADSAEVRVGLNHLDGLRDDLVAAGTELDGRACRSRRSCPAPRRLLDTSHSSEDHPSREGGPQGSSASAARSWRRTSRSDPPAALGPGVGQSLARWAARAARARERPTAVIGDATVARLSGGWHRARWDGRRGAGSAWAAGADPCCEWSLVVRVGTIGSRLSVAGEPFWKTLLFDTTT